MSGFLVYSEFDLKLEIELNVDKYDSITTQLLKIRYICRYVHCVLVHGSRHIEVGK